VTVRAPDAKLIVLRRTDDMTAHRCAVTAALIRIRPDVIDCSTWEAETLDYLQIPPQQRHRPSSAATCPPAPWAHRPSPSQSRISSAAPTGFLPSPRSPRATSQPPTASPRPRSSATASNGTASTLVRCSRPAADTRSPSTAAARPSSAIRSPACSPATSSYLLGAAPGRQATARLGRQDHLDEGLGPARNPRSHAGLASCSGRQAYRAIVVPSMLSLPPRRLNWNARSCC